MQLCLPVEMSTEFDKWVDEEFKVLDDLADKFQSMAKQYGPLMTEKFSDLKKVRYIVEKFQFFQRHELHEELENKFQELKDTIRTVEENVELAKEDGANDHMIKCQQYFAAIKKNRHEKNFKGVA